MLEDIHQQIKDFTEFDGLDLKVKHGDDIYPVIEKSSLLISYDYLLNDDSEYSFNSEKFYEKISESHLNKTDYQIYFQKVKQICSSKFDQACQDTFNFKIVSLNNNFKKVLQNIYDVEGLKSEQLPTFVEILLYTNKENDRAPRVFGFIGHANVLYILFYDPFHSIFNATNTNNTSRSK